jgi:hypothetical protein
VICAGAPMRRWFVDNPPPVSSVNVTSLRQDLPDQTRARRRRAMHVRADEHHDPLH